MRPTAVSRPHRVLSELGEEPKTLGFQAFPEAQHRTRTDDPFLTMVTCAPLLGFGEPFQMRSRALGWGQNCAVRDTSRDTALRDVRRTVMAVWRCSGAQGRGRRRTRHRERRAAGRAGSPCGDPPVAVMDLVGQCMTGLLTAVPQLGTGADRRVVRLHDRDLSDAPFQATAPQLAPAGAERAVAQLHERLEGDQHRGGADQLSIAGSQTLGRSSSSQLMTMVSTTTPAAGASVMPRPAPPETAPTPRRRDPHRRGPRAGEAGAPCAAPHRADRSARSGAREARLRTP